MLRTTVVGSWPPAARFAEELGRYHRGELETGEAEALLREAARVAIEEQRSCGLQQYTGGETGGLGRRDNVLATGKVTAMVAAAAGV